MKQTTVLLNIRKHIIFKKTLHRMIKNYKNLKSIEKYEKESDIK